MIMHPRLNVGAMILFMDKDFCTWFCGFVDGEGCFLIHYGKKRNSYQAVFSITSRADDIEILNNIQSKLGCCKVRWRDKISWKNIHGKHPQAEFRTYTVSDADIIIKSIELGGGLRAKKKRDFDVFKSFVEHKKKLNHKWRTKQQENFEMEMRDKICNVRKFNIVNG
jgi:hypothetical protein